MVADLLTVIELKSSQNLALNNAAALQTNINFKSNQGFSLNAFGALTTAIPLSSSTNLSLVNSSSLEAGSGFQANNALSLNANGALNTAIALKASNNVSLNNNASLSTTINLKSSSGFSLQVVGALTTNPVLAVVHRAEQIMDALTAALSALAPATADKVIRGRHSPFASTINKAIAIYQGLDDVVDNSGWNNVYSKLNVQVDIHVRSSSAQVDQEINAICKVITSTIWADHTLGLSFVIDTEEGASEEPEMLRESNIPISVMRTNWLFKYRRDRTNPSI